MMNLKQAQRLRDAGKSFSEIAQKLRVPESTVRYRLSHETPGRDRYTVADELRVLAEAETGDSYKEISDRLGVPYSFVYTKLRANRAYLTARLGVKVTKCTT